MCQQLLYVYVCVSVCMYLKCLCQDFEKVDARCPVLVREAYSEIESLAAKGEEGKPHDFYYIPNPQLYTLAGLKQITEAFQLCSPLTADKVYSHPC